MPPHLHPRSTATSTLFAGTLLASFIVVGIPHVFPCPRPRTAYAADVGPEGKDLVVAEEKDANGNVVRRVARAGTTSKMGQRTENMEGERRMARRNQEAIPPVQQLQQLQQLQPQTRSSQKFPSSSQPASKALDLDEETLLFQALEAEAAMIDAKARQARECPVPKPSGWVGRILGFEGEQKRGNFDRKKVEEG